MSEQYIKQLDETTKLLIETITRCNEKILADDKSISDKNFQAYIDILNGMTEELIGLEGDGVI